MNIRKKERRMAISVHPAAIMRPRSWNRKLPTMGSSVSPTGYSQYNGLTWLGVLGVRTSQIVQRGVARSIQIELHLGYRRCSPAQVVVPFLSSNNPIVFGYLINSRHNESASWSSFSWQFCRLLLLSCLVYNAKNRRSNPLAGLR